MSAPPFLSFQGWSENYFNSVNHSVVDGVLGPQVSIKLLHFLNKCLFKSLWAMSAAFHLGQHKMRNMNYFSNDTILTESSELERLQNISEICNAPILSADGSHDYMRGNIISWWKKQPFSHVSGTLSHNTPGTKKSPTRKSHKWDGSRQSSRSIASLACCYENEWNGRTRLMHTKRFSEGRCVWHAARSMPRGELLSTNIWH